VTIGRATRDIIAITAIALACVALSASPLFDKARGLSIDVLTLLRWEMFGPRRDPATSPAVVVAIDEETYETPPLKTSPTIIWTGEIGNVLAAILDGGAKVIGFDMVFRDSIEQSDIPFGEGRFGDKVRGFDRDFLRALARGASAGKVVLGEVLRGDQPIRPSDGQRIAVRQQQNIRPLNVYTDPDDIVRRVPLTFLVDGKTVPGMALELASRAVAAPPDIGADGAVTLAGYRIPSEVPNTATLNFDGTDDIPTYSFADLRLCASKGEKDYFRREFAGKVVIIGTVLDHEDQRLTSKRFAAGTEASRQPRCALAARPVAGRFERSSIAGVYIHATAVNNLLGRDAAVEVGRWPVLAIAALMALLAALLARLLRPIGATAAFVGAAVAYATAATIAFNHTLVLPLVEPVGAGIAALAAMVSYRFISSDKDRRLLQKSFAYYLAPDVIAKMLASNKLPQLGGETREVTVLFSDIEGFSQIAERLSPDALMALTNAYLSAMTDVIESCGGYVDKYIGDSVVAVFGAPIDDVHHAASAARAALGCSRRLAELNRDSSIFQGYQVAQRIGINSGSALVGNFGSQRRFNYSVMSDAVNVASRLEGANKFYGTTIIASDTTVALAGEAFAWRELDTIRVKGRTQSLKIYELMAASAAELTDSEKSAMADYAAGLSRWRAGEFDLAAGCFERSAAHDRPSALFRERARQAADHAPDPGWEPVRSLLEK
jgi:adenylate cyclase/guanylate cyclase